MAPILLFRETRIWFYYFSENEKMIFLFWVGWEYDFTDLLNRQLFEEYDENLVRKLLERVTVYDDHLTFEFKCGIEIDITM